MSKSTQWTRKRIVMEKNAREKKSNNGITIIIIFIPNQYRFQGIAWLNISSSVSLKHHINTNGYNKAEYTAIHGHTQRSEA